MTLMYGKPCRSCSALSCCCSVRHHSTALFAVSRSRSQISTDIKLRALRRHTDCTIGSIMCICVQSVLKSGTDSWPSHLILNQWGSVRCSASIGITGSQSHAHREHVLNYTNVEMVNCPKKGVQWLLRAAGYVNLQ